MAFVHVISIETEYMSIEDCGIPIVNKVHVKCSCGFKSTGTPEYVILNHKVDVLLKLHPATEFIVLPEE